MREITIKALCKEEILNAILLVWEVFCKYEAPDYTQKGIDEFYRSIHDHDYLSKLFAFGAFENEKLVGIIATRKAGTHIALFFVDETYQKRGIGRSLFQMALKACDAEKMTVNSSPYAVPIYHHLGFNVTATEQEVNGLRFTPMERKK